MPVIHFYTRTLDFATRKLLAQRICMDVQQVFQVPIVQAVYNGDVSLSDVGKCNVQIQIEGPKVERATIDSLCKRLCETCKQVCGRVGGRVVVSYRFGAPGLLGDVGAQATLQPREDGFDRPGDEPAAKL